MYPTQERDLSGWKITQLDCGGASAMVVADGTNTIAWGAAGEGELGFGADQKSSARPKIIEPLAGIVVKQLSCGHAHTFFLVEKNDTSDKLEKFLPPPVETVVSTEEEPPKKKQKTKK